MASTLLEGLPTSTGHIPKQWQPVLRAGRRHHPCSAHDRLDVTAPAKFYHSASISKEIGTKFEMTVGVTNLFDTRPLRVLGAEHRLVGHLE